MITAAAGYQHSLFRKSDGSVWSTGDNQYYQLGTNAVVERYTCAVVAGATGMTRVAAGDNHSLGIQTNGTVWAFGYGQYGQLGSGNSGNLFVPSDVNSLCTVVTSAEESLISLFDISVYPN